MQAWIWCKGAGVISVARQLRTAAEGIERSLTGLAKEYATHVLGAERDDILSGTARELDGEVVPWSVTLAPLHDSPNG
jgi:hypothetical protein